MQPEKDETESDAEPEITKRAYLTFDDGPSGNTVEILDILDKYDVKATFFVVGRDKSYYDAYRDIVDRGHTLGLHSYTHDYDKIYGSLADFSEDIEELRNLLYDVTGVNCVYYRFPGGSSNTVSRVDMNTLIDYVNAEGLIYYDWNAHIEPLPFVPAICITGTASCGSPSLLSSSFILSSPRTLPMVSVYSI